PIVLFHLRITAFRRLETSVSKHYGLWKGKCRLAEMHPVQVGAEAGFVGLHIHGSRPVSGSDILAHRRRFRHANLAIKERGNRAQGIDLQIRAGRIPGREGKHFQFIGNAAFLQHPQGAERPGAYAVIQENHESALAFKATHSGSRLSRNADIPSFASGCERSVAIRCAVSSSTASSTPRSATPRIRSFAALCAMGPPSSKATTISCTLVSRCSGATTSCTSPNWTARSADMRSAVWK